DVTSESAFNDRRRLVKALAAGPILAGAAAAGLTGLHRPAFADDADPSAKLYPVKRNDRFTLDRPLTAENLVTQWDNFYEFGSQKEIADDAQALPIRPWTVTIDGMVEKPMTVDIDQLLAKMPLEERLYRHRCVEAWSMAVPWSGFALKSLVDF